MNYEALTIRAAELARSGQYSELEKICKKILRKKSKHFDALQLLGFAQGQKGQLNDAIRNLKQARKLDPNHASVRVNLANACLRKGLTEDAIKFSREAVKLNSSLFEGQIALGNALQTAKQYEEAEEVYEQALRLNPASAEATDGLGECYKKQGRLSEAAAGFTRANQINPVLSTAYIHLFQVSMLMQAKDDALKVANAGLTRVQLPASETYELCIGKAKIAWLSGDLKEVSKALDQAKKVVVTDNTYANIINLKAYENCLRRLLEERNEHPDLYLGEPENTIYFIAESHAFAPSEVVVDYQNLPHKICASLITGCKAWHLAREGENEYKASLSCFFSTIPAQSTVVLGFGEIDCRSSEGILKAWHDKGIDYHQSISTLIEGYLKSTMGLAKAGQHQIIIYGVPAPNTESLSSLDENHEAELVEVIQLFNQSLKQNCEAQGLGYLDVYGLTVDENGKSNMEYHIDGYHLHPKVFPLLFHAL